MKKKKKKEWQWAFNTSFIFHHHYQGLDFNFGMSLSKMKSNKHFVAGGPTLPPHLRELVQYVAFAALLHAWISSPKLTYVHIYLHVVPQAHTEFKMQGGPFWTSSLNGRVSLTILSDPVLYAVNIKRTLSSNLVKPLLHLLSNFVKLLLSVNKHIATSLLWMKCVTPSTTVPRAHMAGNIYYSCSSVYTRAGFPTSWYR